MKPDWLEDNESLPWEYSSIELKEMFPKIFLSEGRKETGR